MKNSLIILGFGVLMIVVYILLSVADYIFNRKSEYEGEDAFIAYISRLFKGLICSCVYIMILHEFGIFIQPLIAVFFGIAVIVIYLLLREKSFDETMIVLFVLIVYVSFVLFLSRTITKEFVDEALGLNVVETSIESTEVE